MKLLLLALALGLAGAAPVEDNKECRPHSRPWHVLLKGASCSAALIDPWWMVTAFECAPTPYETIALLGRHDLSVEEDTEQRIPVAEVIHHGPYRSPFHSLAMVRLSRPARLTPYVQPIALPTRCARPGESCQVSGWGSTNQNDWSPRLKCLTVPIVDDQTCVQTFPEYLYWGVMVCAGREDTDNCLTDSESLMVCDGVLQGVRWFGHGCENPAHPTVYSEICQYNDWIQSVKDRYRPTVPPMEH